jgi:hypothetical protein
MDSTVSVSKFTRLFPISHPRAENNRSQLAECGVIENNTFASREREE